MFSDLIYWNGRGKHQKEYDALKDRLVPAVGSADTHAGELLRCIGNLYYERYNNGDCNDLSEEHDYLVDAGFKTKHLTDSQFEGLTDSVIEEVMKLSENNLQKLERYVREECKVTK